MVFRVLEAYNGLVPKASQNAGARPSRRGLKIVSLVSFLALIGLLPVLPALLHGGPVLNNDMLVAYFCYFWDFHRNWSWSHPLVFWSSSYQCGMPMHGYWQSGYLYPVTWLLFGPLSPHVGIYLFYAFHFSLGIYGFLRLGPRLGLHRTASLWAGICFALSGTMLARYEHATFLAGWAWIPLVLHAFLALRDAPGPGTFFAYAGCVALQALGGHPQASAATAILIAVFTVTALLRQVRSPAGRDGSGGKGPRARGARTGNAAWILGGHLLALIYCAPLLIPFVRLVDQTDRFDGVAWEGGTPGETAAPYKAAAATAVAARAGAAEKLEAGVFGFEKFSTGGMRPIHLASLVAPHALGSPSNASWWGGEAWGEVFVYLGGLGLFFCLFAAPRRAGSDLRWVLILGALGLWLSFGAHLGASQILYHIPVLNNFRRPARFLILFAFALAALSGHGFQRWLGRPRGRGGKEGAGDRIYGVLPLAAWTALALAAGLGSLRFLPDLMHSLLAHFLAAAQHFKTLDPAKDYAPKISALLGRASADCLFLGLSAAALWFHGRIYSGFLGGFLGGFPGKGNAKRNLGPHAGTASRSPRYGVILLFAVLLADLLRLHWDHFYLFPSGYYRTPPASARVLDKATSPFWRVSHYLEYPGLELWRMHNDPTAHFDLFDREKSALSCGIHALFGYRHVTAHLPLMWKWDDSLTPGGKSARYLFSNIDLREHRGDSLSLLGRFGSVNAYELRDWRPRLQALGPSHGPGPAMLPEQPRALDTTLCREGYSGYGGLCVREPRDGEFRVEGMFLPGDTLMIRERFSPEWRYRVDGGGWLTPLRSADQFTALPLKGGGRSVEMVYTPTEFYRASAFCLVLTAGLLGFFRFRKKPATNP
jgi:hypothetical protein